MLEPPLPPAEATKVELDKGSSIGALPDLDPMPDTLTANVVLKVGDDISTDEILPAGARALPYRSDIPRLAEFTFSQLDPKYVRRARRTGPHIIVAGANYGQGSSREHAAIAPRHLGLRMVAAKSYARIHWQNLVNFGVLPLEFIADADYEHIDEGDELIVEHVHDTLARHNGVTVHNRTKNAAYRLRHRLSTRQIDVLTAGGQIAYLRRATAS